MSRDSVAKKIFLVDIQSNSVFLLNNLNCLVFLLEMLS